jgi:hypothetical protein
MGGAGRLTAAGAQALAALAEGRADAHAAALAEAERHERAVRAVLEHNARIAVLTESSDRHRAHVAIPMPLDPAGLPVEDLVGWTAATGPLLDRAEEEITRRIAAGAVGSIFGIPAAALTMETAPAPQPRGTASPAERPAVTPRVETLVRVMSRLAPDTTEADRRYVAEAAERVAGAATEAEAEGLLTEVRLRVQAANVHTAERHAEAAADAARRETAEQAAAERDYLLHAVTSAFEELGYEVDEEFETLTAHEGAIVLSKDGWPDHAIKMRVDDDTMEGLDEGPDEAFPRGNIVRAALVRTVEPASEEERRLDVEREEEWCAAFEAARARLTDAGIRSDVRWRIDPGEHRLSVAPEARQTRTRTKQRARSRERNARQEGGR